MFAKNGKIYTLNDWFYEWLNDILPGVVKNSTRQMYRETMERHILPVLGEEKLEDITASTVQNWLDRLRSEPVFGTMNGNMTEGTVRNTLSVLSGCMRDAQKYGLIEKNPCPEAAWKIPARNINESCKWLDEEQTARLVSMLLEYRNKDGYPLGIGFYLILYAGLSMSEALALRWKDIDFGEGMLSVHYFTAVVKHPQNMGGGTEYCLEKVYGRREREVPLPDFLCAVLWDIQKRFQKTAEDFVVASENGEPVTQDRMRAALLRRGKDAGLGRVTPQMLRDTYAMRAVWAGASSDMIAELMGFSSSRQVVRRYMPKNAMDKRTLVNHMYEEYSYVGNRKNEMR